MEKKNLLIENPVLVLFLAACPAMAQSANLISALGIGIGTLLVMLISSLLISALRKCLGGCRIPAVILIVAAVVSLIQMLMNAFLPSVYQMLGVYLAVIAVDLMVINDGEDALELGVGAALKNSLITGTGFAGAVVAMAIVRELLGSGSIAGVELPFMARFTIPVLAKAPGGFLMLAILAAVINCVWDKKSEAKGVACAAAGLCDVKNDTQGE